MEAQALIPTQKDDSANKVQEQQLPKPMERVLEKNPEVKCTCCGESGIKVFIELQEGKHAMKLKKYADTLPFHTAVTLRCVENWFGSHRVVVGDSAFLPPRSFFVKVCTLLAW